MGEDFYKFLVSSPQILLLFGTQHNASFQSQLEALKYEKLPPDLIASPSSLNILSYGRFYIGHFKTNHH